MTGKKRERRHIWKPLVEREFSWGMWRTGCIKSLTGLVQGPKEHGEQFFKACQKPPKCIKNVFGGV
jgi:hypothetical protein